MINLLPQREKDELFLKRIKNLVLVLGNVIIIFLVCLTLVLLSVKFYILAEVDNAKFLLQNTQDQYQTPDIEKLKNAIEKYNNTLPVVLSFYQKKIYISDVLAAISEIQRPEGLHFTAISIEGKTENKIKISISGTSDTRENLIAFQKNLGGQGLIKNVSFSPESWINPIKANFNLTFEYGN